METVLRVMLIYLFILFGLRVMGKREFGQYSPLELITLMLIPDIVSQAVVRADYSLTTALVAVGTLFSLVFATSLVAHLHRGVNNVISGTPSVLVSHGHIIDDNLNKERISPEEIFSEMHKSGLYQLDQIRWAVLEPDGKIAFIPEEGVSGYIHNTDDRSAAI